jgi:glutamate synthase domain-containing protein 2/glutamate synthase domain-containing protein 1/glutamate synthase domain-containing protein 3
VSEQHIDPPQRHDGLYDPAFEHDACGVGFVVDIAGRRSHGVIARGLEVLINLQHRGACGCEANTGDGAGILIQIPDRFLRRVLASDGITLPVSGAYGVGAVFLPTDHSARARVQQTIARVIAEEGQRLLGWRHVPVEDAHLGPSASATRPVILQMFVAASDDVLVARQTDAMAFERKLYVIRKRIEHAVDVMPEQDRQRFYIASLSSRTLIYKGMLTAGQIQPTFPDLADPDMESALALVHQRFRTNTFPSWPLAHPYRLIAHNGEINTLRGNINWMKAREGLLQSPLFGPLKEDLRKVLPVIREGGSDTATFDNVLELLVMAGRPLPHALLMMIPEPWSGHESMDPALKAFYEYHSALMEPWDGPAAIAFTDGTLIGAVLDRNGLRPLRYCVTRDGVVVMASEAGVLDLATEDIVLKDRLRPGRIFLVDTARGRIVSDDEIKGELAAAHPYADWLRENLVDIDDLPEPPYMPRAAHETVVRRQRMFGYTDEDLRLLLAPMASSGEEPIGSMGTDAALAVLSDRPHVLYDYFKQTFAQVTNPPLDAIREQLVTTMGSTVGPEGNLLEPKPESCRQIKVAYPVIDNAQLARLRHVYLPAFRSTTIPTLFDPSRKGLGLERALEDIKQRAADAVDAGYTIVILSDRAADRHMAPIPSLLATAAVHHHLVRKGTRTRCGLVVESGDAREVHHCALLLGYGAGVVNPYLAFETIADLIEQGGLVGIPCETAVANYIHALNKGILKVMSKMGISTLQSYCGAQIFEAIGIDARVVNRHFTGTSSRIGGVGIDEIALEVLQRHRRAFAPRGREGAGPTVGGEYQWRREAEYHLFTPETVFKLQHATRTGQYAVFKEYTKAVDDQSKRLATLRGLLELRASTSPLSIDEVEPVERIVKRFATGAMSYGSISEEAHTTLAIAMNRIGAKSNTGEGGEDPERYRRDPNGDWRRSAVKQVASGRFGVTSEYLVNADELQIKMAQGAKPGEGGQLPGSKVYPWIAKVRYATPGVGLISPPPHHDIYSIEDLAQLIYDLKNANPQARISVKLVSVAGVGTIAAGVAKAHADVVLISGHDGGTGAAPLTSIKHAGIPWELGVAETQQVLRMNGLRGRIVVQTDGQLKTGRDVVVAALLGAEEFGFATAPLVVSGCVMMRVCHLNTCPVGIATQDPALRQRFTGRPEFVVNFFRFIAEEVREYMALLGFRTMDEMIGMVDRLNMRPAIEHWKARGLDYSQLLKEPFTPSPRRRVEAQDHGLDAAFDRDLIDACRDAIVHRTPIAVERRVRNVDRAIGTMVGSEVTRRWGGDGLPDDTIRIACSGSAGQSFGAFIPRGLTLRLEGEANDYIGKGLSGGRIVVVPPRGSRFAAEENVIVGNVALYGATGGEAFIRGIAGERFAVRNSGATTVVEGVGDHGCEYMTGGRVAVLGRTGRNFAAGMSGGVAYVLDADGTFARGHRCNTELVELDAPGDGDRDEILSLLRRHAAATGSAVAARVLADWPAAAASFVKVMPIDYKRALRAAAEAVEAASAAAPLAQVAHG